LSLLPSPEATAQDTPDYFRQTCVSCHTIGGGRATGPDLKDVTQRKDREWLVKFIMNPKVVIDSGDPYAKKIYEEARNYPMPPPPGITRDRAEKLLDLIEAESKLPESQFKGMQFSTAPFTPEDEDRGHKLFLGLVPLENGGPACISCHSMYDIQALGGGRLGPDLTVIFEKYEDRVKLSQWLSAPATETMQPVFKKHKLTKDEIHSLVAYFKASATEQPVAPSTARVTFLLTGLIGAAVWIFLFDSMWKKRFHAVRRPLVESPQESKS